MRRVILALVAMIAMTTNNYAFADGKDFGWNVWLGEMTPDGAIRERVTSERYPKMPMSFRNDYYTVCFAGNNGYAYNVAFDEMIEMLRRGVEMGNNTPDLVEIFMKRVTCATISDPLIVENSTPIFTVELYIWNDGDYARLERRRRFHNGDIFPLKLNDRVVYIQFTGPRD